MSVGTQGHDGEWTAGADPIIDLQTVVTFSQAGGINGGTTTGSASRPWAGAAARLALASSTKAQVD
jgi:hypothetical protein